MNISGIGSTGIDDTRYASRQEEPETESAEQQQEAVTIQPSPQPHPANSNEAQTAKSAVAAISKELAESLESSGDSDDSGDQALINKANGGSALTKSELSRLKEVDPGLYSRAVKAEKAREELRRQMQANPSGASREARSAIGRNDGEDRQLIRKALMDEYISFAAKYDQSAFSR